MKESIQVVNYEQKQDIDSKLLEQFSRENTRGVWNYHKSFPEYKPTPLHSLKNLASYLNIGQIFVKDESQRFDLNAFKVLGGSYSLASVIAEKAGLDLDELSFDKINEEKTKSTVDKFTFITATDGNHGRGIAWTANRLGLKSIVYMPHGSALERLNNIKKLGAQASILDLNYDDSVRFAKETADKNNYLLVQDTSWDGYEDIPKRIMQGYTTMGNEVVEQLNGIKPTHIFLQAGVGAMAGAMTAFFTDYYSKEEERPHIIIVEPQKANCLFKTAKENDGDIHSVSGNMDTIMAGLACGEPCTIAWDILKNYAESFVSMPDYIAAKGMRVLGNPLKNDEKIISGESGAATVGLLTEVLSNPNLTHIKEALRLDPNSRVLCISTEGDTDKENYRNIVWDGKHPSL